MFAFSGEMNVFWVWKENALMNRDLFILDEHSDININPVLLLYAMIFQKFKGIYLFCK